jgi:hypothetical protein
VLGGAVPDPPDVNNAGAELDLVPAQVAELGSPQALPEGSEDFGVKLPQRVPLPNSTGRVRGSPARQSAPPRLVDVTARSRHMLVAFLRCTPRHCTAISRAALCGASQLNDRKFSVAVRASAEGRFTFEIFTVSGEPRTIRFESRHYSSPHDAERAGYEAIAAKGVANAGP